MLAPCHLFQTEAGTDRSDRKGGMFKLMPNEITPDEVQQSILATVETGMEAYKTFVEKRIIGSHNLWDKMTKVQQKTWMSAGTDIKVSTGTDVLTFKATTSLFARLLVIDRSSRESVDLGKVIGMHEFAFTNKILMAPVGTIHPSTDKSIVIKLLEYVVVNETSATSAQPTEREQGSETCIVVDGMGVVQELMAVQNGKTCKVLAASCITLIDSQARGYCQVRVIFDNYTNEA